MDIALGTTPDWIAAVGTAGALIAAVLLLRDDRKVRREQDDEKSRDQAQRIGTWMTSDNYGYRVHLRNASDLPIYNVTVEFGTPAGHEPWSESSSWITLPPGGTDTILIHADRSPTGAVTLYRTRFTDSAERSWERGASGQLRAVSDLEYVGCS